MIYITGDIYNNIDFDKLEFFKQSIRPTKNDVLIIAGDFGIPWAHEKTLCGNFVIYAKITMLMFYSYFKFVTLYFFWLLIKAAF